MTPGLKRLRGLWRLRLNSVQEMLHQQRDVTGPLPQGRHHDGDDVEAVVEVFPEAVFRHQRLQILVGGGDHPDIYPDGFNPADALEGMVLQDPEDLHLEAGAHLRDLVQEDGAAVGLFEAAQAGTQRRG